MVFTDNGAFITVTGVGLPSGSTNINLPKSSYEPRLVPLGTDGTAIHLVPLNGAMDIGYILYPNVITPSTANINELLEVLVGFFNITSMTSEDFLDAINNGTLPAGRWVFVSDVPDLGIWLFCTSTTTYSEIGKGIIQGINYDNSGNYSDIFPITGIATSGPAIQWSLSVETIQIVWDGFTDGPMQVGDNVSDQHGWSGRILETDGTSYCNVYTTNIGLPTVGDTLTDDDRLGTAYIDSINFPLGSPYGTMVFWYDSNHPEYGICMYQVVEYSQRNGQDPAANTNAYRLMHRRIFKIDYTDLSGSFSVNDWLFDVNGRTFQVVSDNGVDSCYVFPRTSTLFPAAGLLDNDNGSHATFVSHGTNHLHLGYIPLSVEMSYDFTNSYTYYIKYGGNSYFLDWVAASNIGCQSLNPLGSFPWGDPSITSFNSENGYYGIANKPQTALIDGLTIKPLGFVPSSSSMESNSSIGGIVVDYNSQRRLDVPEGAALSGWRSFTMTIYAAQLLDQLQIGVGIKILDSTPNVAWDVRITPMFKYGTTTYTGGGTIGIYQGIQLIIPFGSDLVTDVNGVSKASSGYPQRVSYTMSTFPFGEPVTVQTTNGIEFADGDGTLYLFVEYRTISLPSG